MMEKTFQRSLVDFQNFILATRDSGYKSTVSALAELVDNAIEALATKIEIQFEKYHNGEGDFYEVTIVDNGRGMTEEELSLALQFGGSSRFNSRNKTGRYGMGLPNSSLSQCKRVEVVTWKKKSEMLTNYLDVDEIVDQKLTRLPRVKQLTNYIPPRHTKSGTIVTWKKCDRLSFKYLKSFIKSIHFLLGRTFRYSIWQGIEIIVGDIKVAAFDPLFLGAGINLIGGIPYGQDLNYEIKIPGKHKVSNVRVRFVELPINHWAKFSNEDKRKYQISKSAGITMIRADREIDYGWFFMGDKRKENYDDWWRCEISFSPELDEVFGVTHTKQEIKETEFMRNILGPDLEKIAKVLNNRVRKKFIELKLAQPNVYAQQQLERTDIYLPALKNRKSKVVGIKESNKMGGLKYRILIKELTHDAFFEVKEKNDTILLVINKEHLFYDKIFKRLHDGKIESATGILKIIELLLFAAARAEFSFSKKEENAAISDFKVQWSSYLKTLIS